MTRDSFHAQLQDLQDQLLKTGWLVEEVIVEAVNSLKEQDLERARKVIEGNDRVDQLTMDIENQCLRLLALQQPMARDLRAIGTALKIITDLERMADHAVDIARVTLRIGDEPLIKPLVDIPRMAETVRLMIRESLYAYVRQDVDLAEKMIKRDDIIDHLYSQIFRELLLYMLEDPGTIPQATQLLFVGSHLERVADHATNLGEWVIYMVTGERKELNKPGELTTKG
ncbi:MAG: phosphate signaling complex protein PhoU [Firmicutes bacterium]|nr:phosphate signaling complex protein PhoU [Bacillota bacterium]MCL5040471.1 phosphate signaling complex protein PhoU [Bacillota bacterium]